MTIRNILSLFIKILLVSFVCLLFGFLIVEKPKIAIALSFIMVVLPLCWALFKDIEEKKFFLGFFFFYPLLPCLWGIDLGGGLPILRAHRVAILVLLIYLIRKSLFTEYYKRFLKANVFSYAILLIVLSQFITAFFSEGMNSTIFLNLSFILETLILMVVVFNVFKTRDDINRLIAIFCYSTFILCFLGLYEKVTEYNIYTIFGTYQDFTSLDHSIRDNAIRIQGPYVHSIAFGAYLAIILPVMMYKYKDSMLKFYMSAGLVILTVLATQSRGAQIGCVIVAFIFFVFINQKYFIITGIFLIPFVILYSGVIINFLSTLNPFGSGRDDLNSSSQARVVQMQILLGYIKDNFAIGYGLVSTPRILLNPGGASSDSVDNYYLLYTYWYGLVGLFTQFILIATTLLKPIIVFGKDLLKDHLQIVLLSGILAFYIINSIVALLSYHFIFWIYLGILARLIYNNRIESSARNITVNPVSI